MDRIPILQMGEFLLVTIQVDMHDQLALRLQDDLTSKIEKTGAGACLIDISALEMVDSFIGRMIANISGMSSHSGRPHGRGRHAAGRRHHACRIGIVVARREDGAQRGTRDAVSPQARRREGRRRLAVTKADTLPLRNRAGYRPGPADGAQAHASNWHSASSIRPKWSRRPASWLGTPWFMAAAVVSIGTGPGRSQERPPAGFR